MPARSSWCSIRSRSAPRIRTSPPPPSSAQLFGKLAAIQEALILVVQPPPVQGIGNAGGFRMMIEDRAGRGPQALQAAVDAMMGARGADAGPAAGVLAVRDLDAAALSRHRPHQGAAARHQRRRRVRGAADLSRLVLRQRLQPVRPHLPRHRAGRADATGIDPKDVLQIRVRNSSGETVPLGSFTTVRDISGPYRVPRYNLYPAAELDGDAAPGYQPGPGDRDHGEARRRDAAGRLRLRVDDARLPAAARRQHRDLRLRARRWCSCSWCSPRSSRA